MTRCAALLGAGVSGSAPISGSSSNDTVGVAPRREAATGMVRVTAGPDGAGDAGR